MDIVGEQLDVAELAERPLNLGELEIVEQYGGAPLSRLQADSDVGGEGLYRVRFARAMGLVMLRRRARAAGLPDPTWEDAGELELPDTDDDPGEVATTTPDPTPAGRRKRRA